MAKFDLKKYKASIKTADTPYKKDEYVELNDALKEVMGLKGLPLGHVVMCYGPSDSGKSTLGFHAAAQAQKQGILPVFIITEAKVSWERATAMGVDLDNAIVYHAEYLEDVFKQIDSVLSEQASGNLPMDILIIVDSIGNTLSVSSVTLNKDGTTELGGAMMKSAKIIREQMRVCSHKVNNTRKVSSPKVAGLFFVNHAYTSPPAFPGAPSTLTPFGGNGIYYAASLILKMAKGKKLEATKDGKKFKFGLTTKITVDKNHISDVSSSGDFIITASDIIPNEKGAIEDYKEKHKENWNAVEDTDE